MEIVTATGQRIVASSQEHRHLFWVLRGAGQVGYGVVTKLQVKLHTLQEQYVGGSKNHTIFKTAARVPHHTPVICYVLFHDARLYFWNRLPDYFASAREAYQSLACRNLCTITLLLLCPYTGQHRSSAKVLISRRKQRRKRNKLYHYRRFGWKTFFPGPNHPFHPPSPSKVIHVIISQLEEAPVSSNPHTIGLELLGGVINRKSRDSCAYVHRDALYLFSVQAVWTPEDAKGNAHACRRWAEETARSLLPQSLSSYQNYADCGEKNRAQRLENYFGKANIQRLKELKEEYDPLGTFTREHFRL
ncbi:unnamed protein product [Porites evermanni]|uniref:Berberine/berberine-like domain-containing protein n=1 Tax=Porites evermanni TaxID=104178 RepID=A0ABN8MHH8_9CNID|nr:unnamed protein product [Porites evermanni]